MGYMYILLSVTVHYVFTFLHQMQEFFIYNFLSIINFEICMTFLFMTQSKKYIDLFTEQMAY
jgi:hypothetical protein